MIFSISLPTNGFVIKFEAPFFNVFMKIGWHKALREGLKQKGLCCQFNRKPFNFPTQAERLEIADILNYIDKLI